MRGKLLLLFEILFFSQVAVAEDVQERRSSSVTEKVEFEPRYNTAIKEDKLEYLDKKRIARIKKEYNLDWYFSYCGDPRDASSRDDFKCRFKLENLSEVEERSLLVYKTNFLDTGPIDPRLKQKFFEIVEDVRGNGDKGKYGRQSQFVYSKDVLLGIILMDQTPERVAEYKWAYLRVKYLYDNKEYKRLENSLSTKEGMLKIVEGDYEKQRLKNIAQKYDFDLFDKRCGKDYSDRFEFCTDLRNLEDFDNKKENRCLLEVYFKTCREEISVDESIAGQLCTCKPELKNNELPDKQFLASLFVRKINVYSEKDLDWIGDFRMDKVIYSVLSMIGRQELKGDISELYAILLSKEYLLGVVKSYEMDCEPMMYEICSTNEQRIYGFSNYISRKLAEVNSYLER